MMLAESVFQQSLSELIKLSDPLADFRQKAFAKFEEIDFFSKKIESYQYLRLRGLSSLKFERASLQPVNVDLIKKATAPFANQAYLVLYNGSFLPRFSNLDKVSNRIIIKPLSDAFGSYGVFFKNIFEKWLSEEKDPFALLSFAMHQEGLFVYVPNSFSQETPLHIVEISDSDDCHLSAPLTVISCGKNSQLQFSTSSLSDCHKEHLTLANTFLNLEEGAIVRETHYPQAKTELRLEFLRGWLKSNSSYKNSSFFNGVSKMRSDAHLQLLGPYSEAEIVALCTLQEKEQVHLHLLIEHKAESCLSRQLVKNLLDDEAISSFEGKIWVHENAQQTNAYQLNQNCLLSDEARSYSKPNLEIFADDVKASHGSTTGQIDRQQLFYLQSRGLNKIEAQKLLLKAFCYEVIDKAFDQTIKSWVIENLTTFFERP